MSEYEGYDVKQLWQMVDAARQGLQPSHDQAVALDEAQQMLSGHAQALAAARDQLAAKWPPESNAASAAYLTELERLITAVQETALTCAVNVFHLTTVSDAILQTHEALTPLHDEYVVNERSLTKYNAEIDAFSTAAASLPGGKTIAKRAAKLFTSPQVDEGRQAELNQIAKQAMVALAGAAQDGATYIKPPAPYIPPTVDQRKGGDDLKNFGGSGSLSGAGGEIAPPIIRPPTHTHDSPLTSASPANPANKTTPALNNADPILSGLNPVLPITTNSPLAPAIGVGPGNLTGLDVPLGPPEVIERISSPSSGIRTRPSPTQEMAINRDQPGRSGMPRGGVIGMIPGGPGRVESARPQVNPPGGIIGQQPGSVPRSRSGVTISKSAREDTIGPLAGSRREGSSGEGRRWDPRDPWAVDTGVEPVILPGAQPGPIDPGPGIIGIDR